MFLTDEQIRRYADEILRKLGNVEKERDVIYGGTERTWRTYYGFGLSIDDDCGISIKNGDERVFPNHKGGIWELVLEELHRAIPKILAERERKKAELEKEWSFVEDCKNYVLEWRYWDSMSGSGKDGYYEDSLVDIRHNRVSGLSIYEKRRNKWFPLKKDLVLVYSTEDRNTMIPCNALWRRHVESLIEHGKQTAFQREQEDKRNRANALAKAAEEDLKRLREM